MDFIKKDVMKKEKNETFKTIDLSLAVIGFTRV